MKFFKSSAIVLGLIFFLSVPLTIFGQNNNLMDSLSYSVGLMLAQNLQQQGISELDSESLKQGLIDVIEGNDLKLTMDQANTIIQEYFAKKNMAQFEENVKTEQEFLAANRDKDGVIETASGLQYKVLQKGDGPVPSATDRITAHYHGTLLDGRVFDSSVSRGQPATFPVNGVIQGWQEVLQLMPVGSKYRVFIPSRLGYGERGAGDMIGPYSMLIFEIELLSID
jgi:FKBP-type peptidyl-prolyl cis-trans isomerase FklB